MKIRQPSGLIRAGFSKLFAFGFLFLTLTPLALAQDVRTITRDGTTASIKALEGEYSFIAPSSGTTRLVLYRPDTDRQDNAISVFVNDMYHASLVGTGFSDLCIAPGEVDLSARLMKVSDGPKDGQEVQLVIDSNDASTEYVRVIERGDGPLLEPVSAAVARNEMQGSKRQVHTISRVIGSSDCEPLAAAALIELPGDTLFEFGQWGRSGLSGEGIAALEKVSAQIKEQYGQVDQVRVLGHADPIGDPASNIVLSERRAQTILDYLREQGLNSKVALAVGMGSSQPVINCDQAATNLSIACNAPNRRVVIELSGQPN